MKNRRKHFYLNTFLALLAVLILITAWSGQARAFMVQVSENELISNSDLIVTGTVVDLSSMWNINRDNIYTIVTVHVEKGIANADYDQKEIALVVDGGLVEGITQVNTLSPLFYSGEKVVLYLQAGSAELVSSLFADPSVIDKPLFTVYGHFQGKKEIVSGKIEGILLDQYLKQVEKARIGISIRHSSLSLNTTAEDQLIIVSSPYSIIGFKWPASAIPVKFKINPSGGPENSLAAIQDAAATWNSAGANFSFSYDGLHSRTDGISFNGVNEILFFDSPGPELGYASWQVSGPDGVIIEADFYLNTRYSWITAGTPLMGSHCDVQTAALHEFGHFLGLDHSAETNAIMYAFYQEVRRNLHPDDIAGIRAIYGTSAVSYSLTVGSVNPDAGVVIESSSGHGGTTNYSRTLPQTTEVVLTAPLYQGSGTERKRFNGWSGVYSSSDRTITFTINDNLAIIANYLDDPLNDNNDANLSSLTVSQGTLIPAFSPATTSYSVSVPQEINSLNVTATLSDAGASMTINGVSTASGVPRTVSLSAAGTTTPVSVVVTAADGVTVKTYNLSVNRGGGSLNPVPLFIYYENALGEIVIIDYQKVLDDLFSGDVRFRNEIRLKLSEALIGRAIYIQDSVRIVDCAKVFNAGKTYLEAYPDPLYWVTAPHPAKELILNQSTGKGEETIIIN